MPRNAATNRFIQRNANAAISLDGSTSFLAKASPTGINNGTNGSISFSGWMYLTSNVLGTVVELHVNSGTSPSFGMGQQGGVYYLFSDRVNALNNKTITTAAFSQYIGLGRWVRMTYVLTSTEISVYAGKIALLSASALGTAINAGTISSLFLGKGQTVGQVDIQPLGAYLKDWRAFNGALTQTEVNGLVDYNIIPSSVVSGWGMDEGAGSTVTDAIGTNNLTGTALTWTSDRPFAAKKASVNANMVKNGDFEYAPPFTSITSTSARWIDGTSGGSTTNDLFGWYTITGVGNIDYSFDPTVSRSGGYSMRLRASNSTGRGRVLNTPFEATTTEALVSRYGIPVQPNTTYTFSGWIKTMDVVGSSVRYTVREYSSVGVGATTNVTSYAPSGTADWTQYSVTFTTATSTRYVHIQCDMSAAGAIMTAWYDDISLTPVYPEGRVPANGNLVKNFDFEVVPTLVAPMTTAARWIDGSAAGSATNSTYKYAVPSGSFGGGGSANFDSTVSRTGSSSLKLSTNAVGGSVSVTQYVTLSEGIALGTVYRLNPLTSYTLTGWIKTNNAAAGSVTLSCRELNAATSTVVTNTSSSVDGTADWTQVTVTFTTAASTVYGALILRNNVTGNVSDAWFDDIYLAPTTNPGRIAIT